MEREIRLIEESHRMLESARRRAGIDYKKVQASALDILEIAKKQSLNSVEFREALKLSRDALDYSLSRSFANEWFAIAAEKAKE